VLFPTTLAEPGAQAPDHRWEAIAIVGGLLAFLVAGLLLRKGRKLELPA